MMLTPWLGLCVLPLWIWWWIYRGTAGATWRAAALIALTLACMSPWLVWGQGGSDVVLILDRSASMGVETQRHEEIIRLIGKQRDTGDRLSVITVGRDALVAQKT